MYILGSTKEICNSSSKLDKGELRTSLVHPVVWQKVFFFFFLTSFCFASAYDDEDVDDDSCMPTDQFHGLYKYS